MRTFIAAGFGLALGLASITAAHAECMGHDKQKSVQAPVTSTTTATTQTARPRG